MPFVPAPNIIQVEILASKDGALIENRFHVNVFHQPTTSDFTALAALMTTWLSNDYAAQLPADVTITGLQMTSLHSQNAIQSNVALNIVGGLALPAMPNETTYCVSLRSAFIGRSARGRFYVLGLARVSVSTTNRVSAGYRTAITAALQDLINDIAGLSYAFTIVSYINNNAPRPGGPVYFVVATATTTDDVVDSQRRRRPGVGS